MEVGVGSRNVDNLSDAIYGTRLEGDMLDTSASQAIDDLDGLLCTGDTNGNIEAFNGGAFLTYLLLQGELEAELARVDIEGVEGDNNASWKLLLYLGNLRSEGGSISIVVTTASEFNAEASIRSSANEAGLHGRRSHSSGHGWGLPRRHEKGVSRWMVPSL